MSNRGRGRSRGRGDGFRGRGGRNRSYNGRYRYPSSRSISNQSRGRQNDATSDVLNKILKRLEALEKRSNSRVRFSRTENRNQGRGDEPSATSRGRTDDQYVESSNNDFRSLIRESFKYAQTAHHITNWTNCPTSIVKSIDLLVENIKPPQESAALRKQLVDTGAQFKSALVACVNQHLLDTQATTKARFLALDRHDIQRARPIVERQLQRRLGRRLHGSATRAALDEIMSPRPQSALNDVWQEVRHSKRTVPARRTTTESTPLPRSNRFEMLQTDHESDADNGSARRPPPSQPPADIRTSKRPRPSDDGSFQNQEDDLGVVVNDDIYAIPDTDIERTPSPSRSSPPSPPPPRPRPQTPPPPPPSPPPTATGTVRIYHPTDRHSWQINVPVNVDCLVVTDSNGTSWTKANIPLGMHVAAFRGGRIHDAAELLEAATTALKNTGNVAVALGINDYSTVEPEKVLLDLQRIRDWAGKGRKRIAFVEVPLIPSLSTNIQETLLHINRAARDIFGDDFVAIEQTAVRPAANDASGLHYSVLTAKHIIARIYEHFLI